MNTFIVMAEVIQDPQLRYTSDEQIPVAEMLVQFPAQREEDPPNTLKVVGWRNLAQEIHDRCHKGTQVVIEGRLSMVTVERKPEGFKEKRAELTAQRIHYLGTNDNFEPAATSQKAFSQASTPARNTTNSVASESYRSPVATASVPPVSNSTTNVATISPVDDEEEYQEVMPNVKTTPYQNQPMSGNQPDVDDIPF